MEADDRPSDDSFHSLAVIPLSALDKPSIKKPYHRRQTCSRASPRRSPTMVTLHGTRFVECRWWNDGRDCENCRYLTVVGLHDTGPRSAALEVDALTTRPERRSLTKRITGPSLSHKRPSSSSAIHSRAGQIFSLADAIKPVVL